MALEISRVWPNQKLFVPFGLTVNNGKCDNGKSSNRGGQVLLLHGHLLSININKNGKLLELRRPPIAL